MSFLKPTFGIDLQLSGAVVADQFKMAAGKGVAGQYQ